MSFFLMVGPKEYFEGGTVKMYMRLLEQSHPCKIEKVANFTQFCSKTIYISLSKTLFTCKIATVTVHICTVTVTLYMIILFFSLSSPLPCQTLSHPLFNAKKKKPKLTTKTQACRRHERVCECIEPWKLGREIFFFFFFYRFEESTNLIEKERGRKRKNFFFFFRNEKEEEERKKE